MDAALRQPLLHGLGMTHSQVVRIQEYHLLGHLDQAAKEVNLVACVKRTIKNSPGHLPLLVTVAITDNPWRLLLNRISGVSPVGA
jgi:hypothetical protein